MAEDGGTIDRAQTTVTIDHHHPLFLQPSDAPGSALIPIKLTGPKNYTLWSRSMKLTLRGKGKLEFIDGSCKKKSFQRGIRRTVGKM